MRSFSEMFIFFYVIAMTLSSERESIKYPVTKYSLGCYNFLPSFQKGCSMTFTSQVCYMLEKEKGEKNKQHLPPASRATVIGNIIQRYAPAVLSPTEMSEISCISVIEQQEPGLCVCILVEEGDRPQRKSNFKDQTEIKPSSPKSKWDNCQWKLALGSEG